MILNNLSIVTSYMGGRGEGGANLPYFIKPSVFMSFYTQQESVNNVKKSSFPNGYTGQYAWIHAPVAGGMSTSLVTGSETFGIANISGRKAIVAPITAGAVISNAYVSLIVRMISTITAGAISSGTLVGEAQMVAAITADGDLTAAVSAIGHLIAEITASGQLTAVDYAIAHMSADILPYTELSPESLVAAMWNAIASNFTTVGTMGKALADAGAAGNPWTADAGTNNDPGTMGEKLNKLKNPSLLIDGEIIV